MIDASVKKTDVFFHDETKYEMVEDLMIASDILVSDYSGIIFDYCIMHKPIFLWSYDYEEYLAEDREMYFPYEEVTPGVKARDFDGLLKELELFATNGEGYAKEERERVKNLFYCKEARGIVSSRLVDLIENRAFGYKHIKENH